MPEIIVEGGRRLTGEIKTQGSKNAVLPILAALVLIPGRTELIHVPAIHDVTVSLKILERLGVSCRLADGRLTSCGGHPAETSLPGPLVKQMRSSVLFLGSLLGACGKASAIFPGGCAIGRRPVDLHLAVLRQLGVCISCDAETIVAEGYPQGGEVRLPFSSVGATEQALLAAAGAKGPTRIAGAAREPEITALGEFLTACGVRIEGLGGEDIRVWPGELSGGVYEIPGDRIAAGTYLAAAAMTGGEILLTNVPVAQMSSVLRFFASSGCLLRQGKDWVYLRRDGALRPAHFLETKPYPGFPTDMQSVILPLLAVAEGKSVLRENIFENRFCMVQQLNRMGAHVHLVGRCAVVEGVCGLKGAEVTASDLRSGAGLLVAALGAEGVSRIAGRKYIVRGYENPEENLSALGANVKWAETEAKAGKKEN